MMNLQQVRYFLAICEEKNFTRAAMRCRVRQPSLTAAIQRLERELGGTLFVRSSPVRLSALGAAMQPHFVQIDESARRAHDIAAGHTSDRRSQESTPTVAQRA